MHFEKNGLQSGAATKADALQMEEGYFLVWIGIWIIALALLLPAHI
jgi:hypothetical protein